MGRNQTGVNKPLILMKEYTRIKTFDELIDGVQIIKQIADYPLILKRNLYWLFT